MKELYNLRVSNITQETADSVSVSFEVPKHLSEVFHFTQGQYLTLEIDIDGVAVRRAYSICTAPFENILKVCIKKVENGVFSNYATTSLTQNDTVRVMPPQGNFYTKLSETNTKNYMIVAVGSGITPCLSILKSILHIEKQSTVTLLYGNTNSKSIIFKEALDDIKNTYTDRFELHHFLSKEDIGIDMYHSRISLKNLDTKLIDTSVFDEYFICGPEQMILESVEYLQKNKNIDKNTIHFELFTTSNSPSKTQKTSGNKEKTTSKNLSQVSIIIDKETFSFTMDKEDYILEAGIEKGFDLPYSCKGGVCCTCRAKVLEGETNMVLNYALEDNEVKDNFVLTCQTKPVSDNVLVSFD